MKTIHTHEEIQGLLVHIDGQATKTIKKGLAFTVEYRDNGITEAQFSALHVWIRECVKYLNKKKMYRCGPVTGKKIPWTERAYKDDVYKVVLEAMTNKKSTLEQSTVDPNEIYLCICGHMQTAYEQDLCLPQWPSNA